MWMEVNMKIAELVPMIVSNSLLSDTEYLNN